MAFWNRRKSEGETPKIDPSKAIHVPRGKRKLPKAQRGNDRPTPRPTKSEWEEMENPTRAGKDDLSQMLEDSGFW